LGTWELGKQTISHFQISRQFIDDSRRSMKRDASMRLFFLVYPESRTLPCVTVGTLAVLYESVTAASVPALLTW